MSTPTPKPGLNPQQQVVVARLTGDTFVSAGAGSGKTRVLAERFAAIVMAEPDDGARAETLRRILIITFTDKAAGELGERVRRVLLERGRPDLARAVDEAWISTIHGFCGRIVRRHALDLGVDPGFTVLVDPQTGVVRQQAFEEAAFALAGADAEVADLLDAHGVAAVRAAAASGLDQVRAMGRTADALVVPSEPDCRAVLRLTLEDLPELVRAYGELRSLALVEHNRPVLEDLLVRLRSLLEAPPEDLPIELVALSEEFRLKKPGSAKEPVRGLTDQAIEVLETLVQAGTDAVAARQAAAYARLVSAYGTVYESRKAALGALDFEDLQLLVARLFEERPDITGRYAERFLTTMVDEFQDTNDLQLRVVTPIASGGLCVVGDEKQSIYGFRFADVEVFRGRGDAQREADPAGYCPLQTNYRSHPDLLETFNALFGGVPFFKGGYLELLPGRTQGFKLDLPAGAPRAEILLVDRSGWEGITWREAEARVLAGRIARLVETGVSQGDVVVLLRQMTTAGIYVRALRAQGLTVYAESSGGFFATPEVTDARALLAALANPRDGEAVVGLLAGGFGGVSDDALYRLTRREVARPPIGVWGALCVADDLGLAPADVARCRIVRETVERLRGETGRMRLADMLLDAAAVLGPGGGCLSRDGAWANLRKTARIAAEFERFAQSDPAAFLRHLAEREAFVKRESSAGLAVEGADAVRVMTVHAAKGLEFPVVAVADLGHEAHRRTETLVVVKSGDGPLAAARLPKSFGERVPVPGPFEEARTIERARALEEEKRVFYVGCTRAEELLILSGGTLLDSPPGERLAVDWVRTAAGSPDEPVLPGVVVTQFTAEADGAEVALIPGSPSGGRADAERAPAEGYQRARPSTGTPPVPPTDLSYTALVLYGRCPFRFFAERVLGVGSLQDSDADGGARGLGLAVHAALQLSAAGREPDAGRLEALARYHRLDEKGRARLAGAIEAFRLSDAAADLAGRDARPEVRFAVGVAGGTLVGTLDLYARDGERAIVADYKTGAAELSEQDARERFEKQADVYAFALLRSGAAAVEVRFVEVERAGRETVFVYEAAQAEELEAGIASVFERIAAGEYPHLPSFDHDICGDCPVSGSLCPVVRPRSRSKRESRG